MVDLVELFVNRALCPVRFVAASSTFQQFPLSACKYST